MLVWAYRGVNLTQQKKEKKMKYTYLLIQGIKPRQYTIGSRADLIALAQKENIQEYSIYKFATRELAKQFIGECTYWDKMPMA